jgi:5-formyltetrahydrofolate cyclo-ligase
VTTSGALKRDKRAIRRRVLAARDAIEPEELVRLGDAIAGRVLGLTELVEPRTVLGFWSFGSEVPTGPLLDRLARAGHRVLLPRIVGADLELRTWSAGEALTGTSFGAMEPVAGSVISPEAVDIVITPGVAFDPSGGRVGYGGGFYDRLLRRTRPDAVRVAIAADLQVVDGPLPAGDFDLPVDVIVTPTRVLRPRGGGPVPRG